MTSTPPADVSPTKCRTCGKPIFFALTSGGKLSPFDWDDTAGPWHLTGDAVDGTPRIVYDPEAADGYVTHFATCPDADQHRRPAAQLELVPDQEA